MTTIPAARARPRLEVRAPRLAYEAVPRAWLAGSVSATHVANGVNLLFPAGERFFVRSVRHFLDEIASTPRLSAAEREALLADVRGFFGQEGRHAQAHERFFDVLREQGYGVDAIVARYERLAFGFVERHTSPALRLAVTVACEHFTAILAEDALDGDALRDAHPAVASLLAWHAVEELEHKSVAFDVMAAVRPGYGLRVAGLALATVLLGGFWLEATRGLLAEDGRSLRDAARELAELRRRTARGEGGTPSRGVLRDVFLRGIRDFVRPSFHPRDVDHSALVAAALARLSSDGVVDAPAADVRPRTSARV